MCFQLHLHRTGELTGFTSCFSLFGRRQLSAEGCKSGIHFGGKMGTKSVCFLISTQHLYRNPLVNIQYLKSSFTFLTCTFERSACVLYRWAHVYNGNMEPSHRRFWIIQPCFVSATVPPAGRRTLTVRHITCQKLLSHLLISYR